MEPKITTAAPKLYKELPEFKLLKPEWERNALMAELVQINREQFVDGPGRNSSTTRQRMQYLAIKCPNGKGNLNARRQNKACGLLKVITRYTELVQNNRIYSKGKR